MDYQTISNLLLPPKSIRMLVRENMRLIVFALLAAQIVVAVSIDLFIRKNIVGVFLSLMLIVTFTFQNYFTGFG